MWVHGTSCDPRHVTAGTADRNRRRADTKARPPSVPPEAPPGGPAQQVCVVAEGARVAPIGVVAERECSAAIARHSDRSHGGADTASSSVARPIRTRTAPNRSSQLPARRTPWRRPSPRHPPSRRPRGRRPDGAPGRDRAGTPPASPPPRPPPSPPRPAAGAPPRPWAVRGRERPGRTGRGSRGGTRTRPDTARRAPRRRRSAAPGPMPAPDPSPRAASRGRGRRGALDTGGQRGRRPAGGRSASRRRRGPAEREGAAVVHGGEGVENRHGAMDGSRTAAVPPDLKILRVPHHPLLDRQPAALHAERERSIEAYHDPLRQPTAAEHREHLPVQLLDGHPAAARTDATTALTTSRSATCSMGRSTPSGVRQDHRQRGAGVGAAREPAREFGDRRQGRPAAGRHRM